MKEMKISMKGKSKKKTGYDWFDKMPEKIVVVVQGNKKEYPMKKCSICGSPYEVVKEQSTKNWGAMKPTCKCIKSGFRICVG